MITSKEFIQRLETLKRPTREMLVTPGDPGCKPITKISGVPWWPAGVSRPKCSRGHFMSFMGQFLLTDIPGFELHTDSLVSFHYCQECSYEGNMSWGWEDSPDDHFRYDISIIKSVSIRKQDDLGTVAEVVISPHHVAFRDVIEVPSYEDTTIIFPNTPADYPQGEDDLDENIYPGLIHIHKRKVGGWPSWVQYPTPPIISVNEQLSFLGQLDWRLCNNSTWAGGGYAYLFIILSDGGELLRGDLAIQTT